MSKEKHFVLEDSGWKTDTNIFFYKKTLCTAAKNKTQKISLQQKYLYDRH